MCYPRSCRVQSAHKRARTRSAQARLENSRDARPVPVPGVHLLPGNAQNKRRVWLVAGAEYVKQRLDTH